MAETDSARIKDKGWITRYKNAVTQRKLWEDDWRDITSFIAPRRGRYLERGSEANKGDIDLSNIYDSTGVQALKILASGMHGGLTSPARPWFKLVLEDSDLMKYGPVKDWMEATQKILYSTYAKSNFYRVIHGIYSELGAFAIAAMLEEEDNLTSVRFSSFTVGEYVVGQNERGVVDYIGRLFWMTASNLVKKFGSDNVSEEVREAAEEEDKGNKDKYYKVLFSCQPREGVKRGLGKMNRPYESVYIEYDKEKILDEGGHYEFPVFVPRWDVIGSDTYGLGPSHDNLPDVKMLQDMKLSSIKAQHKTNDPPMAIPTEFKDRLNLLPGAENYFNMRHDTQIKPLYQISFDLQGTHVMIQDIRDSIKRGYYNDLFLMMVNNPYGQPPTATEIAERHEEKLIMLGPVIERQIDELLNPCHNRTLAILFRNEKLPIPPPEIQNQELNIEYIGLLAQAQRLVSMQGINTVMNFALTSMEAFPTVLDRIDIDKTIDIVGDSAGAPIQMIRPLDKAIKIRDARDKIMEEEKEKEEMMMAAQGMKTMAEAGAKGGV